MPTARQETSNGKTTSRRSASRGTANKGPNALVLLRDDHKEVSDMFEKFEKRKDRMNADQKQKLVSEICLALTVHAQIEEEIFYPEVGPEIDDEDLMDEAVVEHRERLVEHLLQRRRHRPAGRRRFRALAVDLGLLVLGKRHDSGSPAFAKRAGLLRDPGSGGKRARPLGTGLIPAPSMPILTIVGQPTMAINAL